MISVKNLKKLYYKGRENEIKVINNTTLELPNTGLVFFLGNSGSGKTTLLNVIGGLDKADSGSISYDGLEFSKYKMNEIDNYRKNNIGYIFQNYLLIEEKTVYENLRIALEIVGVTNKEEVDKRIEYALKAVGLFKYRRKPAGNLSGGQQQRVAIARCLVKKSKVIIADEPTGNLDSENTIEVMNILKKISKESLVLVVTHSLEVSSFYADKIVEIKDGNIIAYKDNISTNTLESLTDRRIHLLDYNKANITSNKLDLDYYIDDKSTDKKITIVVKDNVIYIDTTSNVQIVHDSNVTLLEDHYKHLEQTNVDDFTYDTSWFNDGEKLNSFKAFFIDLCTSFKDFYKGTKSKKIFDLVFVLIGAMVAVLMIFISKSIYINYESFNNEPGVYQLSREKGQSLYYDYILDDEVILKAIEDDRIKEIYQQTSILAASVKKTAVESTDIYYKGLSFPYSKVADSGLLCGTEPKNDKEIVLGKISARKIIEKLDKTYNYNNLIGIKLANYIVSGISNLETNSIYMGPKYTIYGDGYNVYGVSVDMVSKFSDAEYVSGSCPTNENEIALSSNYESLYFYFVGDTVTYNDKKYTVSGFFNNGYIDALTLDESLLATTFMVGTRSFVKPLEDIVVDNNIYNYIQQGSYDYRIIEGTDIKEIGDVLLPCYSNVKLNTKYLYKSIEFKVVGKYYTDEMVIGVGKTTDHLAIIGKKDILKLDYVTKLDDTYASFEIDDSEEGIKYFADKGVVALNVYDHMVDYYKNSKSEEMRNLLITEVVILTVIVVYTYFSCRAKMIREIYDIGVKRMLGCKRSKIILKNLIDIFTKTTLTALLGYLLVFLIYFPFAIYINVIFGSAYLVVNWKLMLQGVLIIYVIEIVIGIIPMIALLRKTPAQINARYDI